MRTKTRLQLAACLLLTTVSALPALAQVTVEVRGPEQPARLSSGTALPKVSESNTLMLPFFRATLVDPNGETTLYAVRNNSGEPVTVRYSYHGASGGNPSIVQEEVLPGHGVRSVNLQLVDGLSSNGSGISTGYILIEALGNSLPAGVISGDYFRVDPSEDAANGGNLIAVEDTVCRAWSHRFFSGGGFDGGSKISFFVLDRPSEGPTVSGNVYNEAGEMVAVVDVTSSRTAFEITDQELDLPVNFGSIDWIFQGNGHGSVATTFSAAERFSAGVEATCVEDFVTDNPPPPPSNAVVFELPGNFFTCNRCGNYQYNMPIPGGRRNFSKVIVDFELFVAGFDSNRPSGFHCLFWLNNGNQWRDMIAYLNSRGTRNQSVFQVNGPLGNPIGMERTKGPGVLGGETYNVHYEYDTVNKVVFYEIRRQNGDLRVADTFALPNNTGPLSTSFMFIQFGTQAGEVESRTERWRWSNFKAQFIPAE